MSAYVVRMLSKPTPQQLSALATLAAQAHWKQVDTMLKEELAKTIERLLSAQGTDVGQLQGRAKFLTKFIEMTHKPSASL